MKTLLKVASLADIWLFLWGWIDEDWSLMTLAGIIFVVLLAELERRGVVEEVKERWARR